MLKGKLYFVYDENKRRFINQYVRFISNVFYSPPSCLPHTTANVNLYGYPTLVIVMAKKINKANNIAVDNNVKGSSA